MCSLHANGGSPDRLREGADSFGMFEIRIPDRDNPFCGVGLVHTPKLCCWPLRRSLCRHFTRGIFAHAVPPIGRLALPSGGRRNMLLSFVGFL